MSTQLTEQQNHTISTTTDLIMNHQVMAQMQQLAELMCNGKVTVPKHLQGSPADCMAIVMQAAQWQMNPYAVAQKTHLVHGTLGYEAQLVNAIISSSKAIKGRFHYKYGGNWPTGNDAWVQVGAVLAGESEIQWGEPLYQSKVTTRNSPLWETNPKQQAAYLATKYWARLYAPAVILGVYSVDELEGAEPTEKDITPTSNEGSTLSGIINAGKQAATEAVPEPTPAPETGELSGMAVDFMAAIDECVSMAELEKVAPLISTAYTAGDLGEFDRQELSAAYKACKQQITQAEG